MKDRNQLRKASDHLFYEIEMLRGTMSILGCGALGNSVLANAAIESFTVHARTLIDFLYPGDNPHETDVLAEHFFPDPEAWDKLRPSSPPEWEEARRRVNKEIAHLTYDRQRVDPELKGWDYMSLGNQILERLHVFLRHVRDDCLGARWRRGPDKRYEDITSPIQVAIMGNFTTNLE